MPDTRILVTGAAGRIGTVLRAGLARPGRVLRLLDVAPQPPAAPGEPVEPVTASFLDPDAVGAACRDVDAVVHLGGLAGEAPWPDLAAVNIDGTRLVLDAARQHHVPRVVLASSIHAAGFRTAGDAPIAADTPPRPDTYYGASKAAAEALGALFHARYGTDITCLRIGAFRPRPVTPADLAMWLSYGDAVRLVDACLTTTAGGYRVVWGISRNTRRWFSTAESDAIGYRGVDDAETHAGEIGAGPPERLVGGTFCAMPLGRG